MGISKFLRSAGHGAASLGRAVSSAVSNLDQTLGANPQPSAAPAAAAAGTGQAAAPATPPAAAPAAPAPAAPSTAIQTAPAPTTSATPPAEGASAAKPDQATAAPAPRGFALPDLGPAPDPKDPKYNGDAGQKQYQADLDTYNHKQDIHDAFNRLDAIYTQAHPHRDFQKEYEEEVAMQNQHDQSLPTGSPLKRFALALGDQGLAMRESGRSNLADYDKQIGQAREQSNDSFSKRLALRIRMHESAAADAEQQGNWKKALAENEQAALMRADEQAIQHKRDMEKTGAIIEGQNQRARMHADSAQHVAQIRASSIATAHGLSGGFQQEFEKQTARYLAKYFGPQNLNQTYDPAEIDAMIPAIEHIAETLHDQQYGDGSHQTYLGKHPNKRPQPKGAGGKPTF